MLYQKLINIKEKIESQLHNLITSEKELELYFNDNYATNVFYSQNGQEVRYGKNDFAKLYSQSKDYLEKQLNFIDRLIDDKVIAEEKYSIQLQRVLEDYSNNIENGLAAHGFYENLIFEYSLKSDFSNEYNSIFLLSNFSWFENNVVLIGGNGSGKSNLAKTLKGSERESISVIPAQKTLYYSMNDPSLFRTRLIDLENLHLENNIDRSKSVNNYDYFNYQNNQFTKLIVGMKEDYFDYLSSCAQKGILSVKSDSIFGKMEHIFSSIFPEISLNLGSDANGFLECEKNGNKYHVNSLSEGEKAVIYYSLSVLTAKTSSFIVVDEPETYLNVSLTNSLWSMLLNIRKDCKFIFITHSVDFVLSRSDFKILWIKKYVHPNNWEFVEIENSFELPRSLITEVLGSKKPILFCEGNDKSSLDYEIYHALYGDKYTIIPVGGHLEVIQYTTVLYNSKWLNIECKGIIDGDNLFGSDTISKLKEKNISVLPFNEIEMMLLSEDVMTTTISSTYHDLASKMIEEFKEQFWILVDKKKDKIIMNFLKNILDSRIKSQGIQKYDSTQSIKDDIENNLKGIVDSSYSRVFDEVSKILDSRQYSDLLTICNLKKEVSKGLADKLLDGDYERKAVLKIKNTDSLKEGLLKIIL